MRAGIEGEAMAIPFEMSRAEARAEFDRMFGLAARWPTPRAAKRDSRTQLAGPTGIDPDGDARADGGSMIDPVGGPRFDGGSAIDPVPIPPGRFEGGSIIDPIGRVA